MAILRGGNGAIKTLAQMSGLIIGLYVFDQIINVVTPQAYGCGASYTPNITGHNCYLNTNNSITKQIPNNFGQALIFMQNLFGIVGIIGVFEIIYKGLRRSGFI